MVELLGLRNNKPLSKDNRDARLSACQFWLNFPEKWFENLLGSDEKCFVLHQDPNRKNSVVWAVENPHMLVDGKNAHGSKIMVWVGFVNGKCLPAV